MQLKQLVTRFVVIPITLVVVGIAVGGGCHDRNSTQAQGERDQENVMGRAISQVPVPEVNNFLTRKTVAKWMRRMDVPSKEFYVYVVADNGQVMRYYVASSRPVNICTFLTPTEREIDVMGSPNPLGQAPALDGVYYGSGGACDSWYFFDAETDAYVELVGVNLFFSDQPLVFETDPIKVMVKATDG